MEDFSLDDFKDVTPVPQDDGPHPIVPIAYDEEFVEVMDIFRAILRTKEYSQRTLRLTKAVIDLNAANYTAWNFRRECLFELGCDLKPELDWTASVARESAKNYQLWHHRRCLVEKQNNGDGELEHVAEILAEDAKNYHAWSHRQWVLKKFELWDEELKYVEGLLNEDLRNNSAWNQRHFVISNTTGFTPEVVDREIKFTCNYIEKALNNESPWNYLLGVAKASSFEHTEELIQFGESCTRKDDMCSAAFSFLVEIYNATCNSQKAIEACEYLAKKADVIRSKYWLFRIKQISKQS